MQRVHTAAQLSAAPPLVDEHPGRSPLHESLRRAPDYASQAAMLAPGKMSPLPGPPEAAMPALPLPAMPPAPAPPAPDSRVPSLETAIQELIEALESGDCDQQAYAEATLREVWAAFRAEHEEEIVRFQKNPPKPGTDDYKRYLELYNQWHTGGSALYLARDKPCDEGAKNTREDVLTTIYGWRQMGPKPDPKKDPKPKKPEDPTPEPDPPTPLPQDEDEDRVHIEFNLFETPELNVPAGLFKLKGGISGRVVIDAAADMSDATAQVIIEGELKGLFNAAGIADIGLKATVTLQATADATWSEENGWSIAPMEGDLDVEASFMWDTWGEALDGEQQIAEPLNLLRFNLPGWSQQGGLQGNFDISPGEDVEWLMNEIRSWVPGM